MWRGAFGYAVLRNEKAEICPEYLSVKYKKVDAMKYHIKKRKPLPDYYSGQYNPCWTCKKAYGLCRWSRDFKPIPGWNAIPTHHPSNGVFADSYKIISCPEYVKEERK